MNGASHGMTVCVQINRRPDSNKLAVQLLILPQINGQWTYIVFCRIKFICGGKNQICSNINIRRPAQETNEQILRNLPTCIFINIYFGQIVFLNSLN